MMRHCVYLLIGCALVLTLSRCDGAARQSTASVPIDKLLKRSDARTWVTRDFAVARVGVSTPADACWVAPDLPDGVSVQFHTVTAPKDVLDDNRCLLELKLQRMNMHDFTERIVAGDASPTADERAFWRWLNERHHEVSRRDDGAHSYYRRDVSCTAGDIVSARVAILNVYDDHGRSKYADQDELIARQMLNSVHCLP